MGATVFLFVNATKNISLQSKRFCLGNISADFSANNMKKGGLNEFMYDFFVDYKAFDISDIKNIHKCLIKKMM